MRRWREGGQSVRTFCRAENVRESAFYFWRRELARLTVRWLATACRRRSSRGPPSDRCRRHPGRTARHHPFPQYGRSLRTWPRCPVGWRSCLSRGGGCGCQRASIGNTGRCAGRAGGAAVLSLSELVRIYVCLTPMDMRNYAVTVIMRSWAERRCMEAGIGRECFCA